jgi:two-component system CheB/CheR fusion protein
MDSFNAEFRRQLRSLFAVLRAIVRRSSGGDGPKADYAAVLEGRIGALARAHDMLMRAPEQGVDLAELVHAEMLAQTTPAGRYRAAGPDTRIDQEAVIPIALALHELAVNALLYGAFAVPQGSVDIVWAHLERAGSMWLRISWLESGVHLSGDPPTNKGFGLELLESTLTYELSACTSVAWPTSGARIEIQIPSSHRTPFWRPAERAIAV